MATEEDDSILSGSDTLSADEDEVDVGMEVETLVSGREKRSTAGRHMNTLLDAEADDDLALLFAEDEGDEEFDSERIEDVEDGAVAEDDDLMDSSSDEDDQGPNVQDEELEGEKEIEKQAKAERAKKRKAQDHLRLTALRKKVKIDPTATPSSVPTTPAPRLKKKSERVSWLPTPEDGPTRSSSRRQTMQNKELTHARLKDSEEKRVRLIATMEEAAKRKEQFKPKEMTQEDRLAEAAKTERLNSKSLNHWEETEKRKNEEQRARLEALQNRRLEGPVMTLWSGIAKWVNDRLAQVGSKEIPPEAEAESGKKKAKEAKEQGSPKRAKSKKTEKAESGDSNDAEKTETTKTTENLPDKDKPMESSAPNQPPLTFTETSKDAPTNAQPNNSLETPPQEPTRQGSKDQEQQGQASQGFLDGIHLYASMSPATDAPPAAPAVSKDDAKSDHSKDAEEQPQSSEQPSERAAEKLSDKASEQPPEEAAKTTSQPIADQPATETDDVSDKPSQPPPEPAEQKDVEMTDSQDPPPTPTVDLEKPRKDVEISDPPKTDIPAPPAEAAEKTEDVQKPDQPQSASTEKKAEDGQHPDRPKSPSTEKESSALAGSTGDIPDVQMSDARKEHDTTARAPALVSESVTTPAPASAQHSGEQVHIHVDNPESLQTENRPSAAPEHPGPEPKIEISTRNLTVLENFDSKTMQEPEYAAYFTSKKLPKHGKHTQELCVITSLPARYRDPSTGLAFGSVSAYREIQRAQEHKFAWSKMLGCYVGPSGVAARGVPERFIFGDSADKREKKDKAAGSEKGPSTEKVPSGSPAVAVEGESNGATPAEPAPATPAGAKS